MNTSALSTEQLLADFAAWMGRIGRSETTINGYVNDLRYFSRWLNHVFQVSINPTNLLPEMLRLYQQELLDAGFMPQSVNRKLAAVIAYCHWAVGAEHILKNPSIHVRNLKKTTTSSEYLEEKQKTALIRAIEADLRFSRQRYPRLWLMRLRDATMLTILMDTKLRLTDLCGLTVDNVITNDNGCTTITTHTNRDTKTIPISTETTQYLIEWMQHRPTNSTALFVNQRGNPVSSRSIQLAVQRYSLDAGLRDITAKTLQKAQ